jgi:hypothetical protein
MSQYAGVDVFPESADLPDDSAPPKAAPQNVVNEAVLDRTRYLFIRERGGHPAFSHFELLSATNNIDVVKFNPATRDWYGASTTVVDKFQRTMDYTTWPGTTEITGGALVMTPVIPGDFEFNASGHGILMGNTIDIYAEYNGATWTRYGGALGSDPSGAPRCVTVKYSPTSGRWAIAFSRGAGLSSRVYYGTDRVTWANVDLPFPNDTEVKLGSNGANTLVAMGREGTNLHLSRSTDGGATWSAVVTIDTLLAIFTGVPQVEPVWTGKKWIVIASSSGASKVYSSSDGLAWSAQASLTSGFIQSLAAADGLLVGGMDGGDLITSADLGATFRFVDRRIPSAALGSTIWTGTRLVLSGGTTVFVSQGRGPGSALVT